MNFIWGLIVGAGVVGIIFWIVCATKCKSCCSKSTPLDSGASNGASAPKRDLMKESQDAHAEMISKLETYLVGKTEVANDEIQSFLGVSDASAERYLQELETQGKLKQVGKTGTKTHYQVNPS